MATSKNSIVQLAHDLAKTKVRKTIIEMPNAMPKGDKILVCIRMNKSGTDKRVYLISHTGNVQCLDLTDHPNAFKHTIKSKKTFKEAIDQFYADQEYYKKDNSHVIMDWKFV